MKCPACNENSNCSNCLYCGFNLMNYYYTENKILRAGKIYQRGRPVRKAKLWERFLTI